MFEAVSYVSFGFIIVVVLAVTSMYISRHFCVPRVLFASLCSCFVSFGRHSWQYWCVRWTVTHTVLVKCLFVVFVSFRSVEHAFLVTRSSVVGIVGMPFLGLVVRD